LDGQEKEKEGERGGERERRVECLKRIRAEY
jgi:hypothetical protein